MGNNDLFEDRLREFIVGDLGWQGTPTLLTTDYQLIDNDVIDSLGIFELVTFIEEEFEIEIDDEELVLENFATLGTMGTLVRKKVPA